MKHRLFPLLLVLAVTFTPQAAVANAGTPLMWAGMLHLVVGNALIGIGEGLLLTWWFGVSKRKSVTLMILANYASAWLGGLFLRGMIVRVLPLNLNNGWSWFWVMVVVTYGMTLLLELPFIASCFRGSADRWRTSWRAALAIQSVSYLFLFGWYWLASGMSLYTRMHIVEPAELSLPESVIVYFIAPRDGHAYMRSLSGRGEQKAGELYSTDPNDRLFVRWNQADTNRWDLVARLETDKRSEPRFVEIQTNMLVEAVADWRSTHTDPPQYKGTWFNFGRVSALGMATNSQWECWAGFWAMEGLRATHTASRERVRFSYETPFGSWAVRNAVLLPSDKVLFQLGDDQICAFDPERQRVALLWRGRGPVAIIPKVDEP